MDVVIVRENEEDLYTGIEYQQTQETFQALKIITRSGCEKIIRYAFEYALSHGRKKVSCFTKDNILKLSDGLFHKVFEEIATDYPMIENEHWIIDIGSAKLADTPEDFDVIVVPNLYGDILSDISAQIAGSVGLAGSANIGEHGNMFEAIHGSAPTRAGKNSANPSGLLFGSIMMLAHLGMVSEASLIHNSWLKTIEEGIHTDDIFKEGISSKMVGTKEFAEAVAKNLGKEPTQLKKAHYEKRESLINTERDKKQVSKDKKLVGVDLFLESLENVDIIQKRLQTLETDIAQLQMIGNRGVKVWPGTKSETHCVDQWRCRFMAREGQKFSQKAIIELLEKFEKANVEAIKMENLYQFDGQPGYSIIDS